ncbi:MAG: MBL fold metallo-hydrolase [Thermoanaerobaculia bacterium]
MAQVTFVGACGTVTGSCTMLDFGAKRLLVDCGLFQGDNELEGRNWKPFPFRPQEIDAVVLTHAHLDHTGLLPRLVAQGFHGPIYCTKPTRPLASLVLQDAGHLQEEQARFAKKRGYSRYADPKPLFTAHDATEALQLLEPLPFGEEHELFPGITVRFVRAGHLLGAASLTIAAKSSLGGRQHWCFSGDVGRYDAPILRDPEPPTEVPDALLLESTYGDRRHPHEDSGARLEEIIHQTFARGGSVVIPAFALGRTQDLLFFLSELALAGKIDPSAVFLDSPMAIKATEIYRQAAPELDEETQALIRQQANPLAADRFRRCSSVEESKALNERREPAVIVAASGMATGGRVVHHLEHRLPDRRNAVVFVGYQGNGTRGRSLLDGAQNISIHGRPIPVAAEIVRMEGMSAHGDVQDLLRWCKALPGVPRRIFLNHGEDGPRKALSASFVEMGWPRPELPAPGTVVDW